MISHVELLIEEESAEAALRRIIPRLVGPDIAVEFRRFQGKVDLLQKLDIRLRGYQHWISKDFGIIILVDADQNDCRALKARLESAARSAKLTTRSSAKFGDRFQVLNRIAVEELEAWFFGDIPALRRVFPRVPGTLDGQVPFRDSDAIPGGTWEALLRVLKDAGYFASATRLPKVEVADRVSQYMNPDRNRSRSFQVFRDGLRALVAQ
jgi:hypothetical protein